MDTGVSFADGKYAFASTDDPGIKAAWLKRMKEWPDEVQIIRRPEDNDGCLYIRLPLAMVKSATKKLIPARRKPMSEAQMAEASARLAAVRASRKGGEER